MSTSLDLSKKFSSLSGVDIRVVIAGQTLGVAQALSYAVQREKAPVYVMGRVDPISFSRGKRGIAGTLITLMLDQHILFLDPFKNLRFLADGDEILASPNDPNNAQSLSDLSDLAGGAAGSTVFDPSNISANYQVAQAWYVDQLPPIDTVIIGVNEYGNAASMRIYGLEILNEGSGFSVDDMVIENQMTYTARSLYPWQKLGSWDITNNGSFQSAY